MNSIEVFRSEQYYKYIFWSSFFNGVGSRFAQVGSFALVYILTESSIAIGVLLAFRVVPTIVLAPISGYLADRYNKIKILFLVDLIRAPFAFIPIFIVFYNEVWILYLSTLIIACCEALYRPVRFSVIPELVKRKNLTNINGLEQNIVGFTLVFGSLTGGVIAYLSNVYFLFILHALLLILASISMNTLLKKYKLTTREKMIKQTMDLSPKETSILIFKVSILRVFLIIMLLMPIANGIDNVLFNLFALDVYNKGDLGVGVIYAALGAGFILSSTITKWLKTNYIKIAIFMIALEGLGHVILSQTSFFYQTVLLAILITFFGGISNICFDTVLMKILPPAKRGAIFGTLSMIQNSSMGLAMIGAGFLTNYLTPANTSLYVGLTYFCFSGIFLLLFRSIKFKSSVKEIRRIDR